MVKTSSGIAKRYIALFGCCATRAIHLEVAEDLSTESFILLFRRFCARRSTPSTVVSDNATCFLSGKREIEEILEDEDVKAHMSSHSVRWINIPGQSPAWGGQYERLIGVMKSTLKKVLGHAMVTDGELHTIICESRPC